MSQQANPLEPSLFEPVDENAPLQRIPTTNQAGAAPLVLDSGDNEQDFRLQPVDSANFWTKFWSAHYFRFFDKKAEYAAIGGDEAGPAPRRDVKNFNLFWGFGALTFFVIGDGIATIVLHNKNVYSTTKMAHAFNNGMVLDALANAAVLGAGATFFTTVLPQLFGTAIGYRFNKPKHFSAASLLLTGVGKAALDVYLLHYSNKQRIPEGAITYDSTLTAPTTTSLEESIVLATNDNNKNYTIGSIVFTGNNREGITIVSPPAVIMQNGTHFNITFQPAVLVFNNRTQEILLQYPNPSAIVPPIRDVKVAVLNDVPKTNETTSEVFSAPIHGLDLTKRATPGLVDWQTVFNPNSNVTVDSANEVIIGPLQLNDDGSYSLLNPARDVPRYHEALQRGIKYPDVPVKLYTSSFDPNTPNVIGGNNVTCANLCNNTATLLNDTGADGMIFDLEGGWNSLNPVPVNSTNIANMLNRSLLPSNKTVSITLPLNDANIIWPKAALQQVAKTGATFYPVGYRTFLPGQFAGYSSPLDVLQNMTNYYTDNVGNKIGAIALSCATQCYTVNETMPFEPYVPFGRAVVTGLTPGQYPTVAESLYSETCLVTDSDCAGGTPLGAELIVSPPDAHSASQQGLMVDRDHSYVCTGQMITPGDYSFDTMTNAAKVIARKGYNVAVSNQYWDQDGDLTKAIAKQYSIDHKTTPTPTHSPTSSPTPTPTQNSTHAERAESYNTGRKPLSLGGAGMNWGDEKPSLPSLKEVATTATYAGLSSVIATLARNVMKDMLIAYKKDAAAKAAGKPEEEQSAVADYMFLLANVSMTLLPALYSSSSIIDAQTKVMSLAMVLAISFGLQLINKTPQLVNGVIAGTAPIAMKTLENLIAGNHTLMKDVILMFSALLISSGLAFVTDKLYEPGKALLLGSMGMFGTRSNNAANRPVSVTQAPIVEQDLQRSFAAV